MTTLPMRFNLLTLLFFCSKISLIAQTNAAEDYIEEYRHIAIAEMHRSGIPASITLAQGIFESAYGKSLSATKYNNHFGIKCKKAWTGKFFYKEDDDFDKNGNLIASCFRGYDSPEESYIDHTNFLMERDRYRSLFGYHHTDYPNWAIGLQKCGYATNKTYGTRLIELIERYQLWKYDHEEEPYPAYFVASDNSSLNLNTTWVKTSREEILSPVPIDSISMKAVSVETVVATQATNRVNRAIILPARYQRGNIKERIANSLN
ncbi:MAG: glucosaminidase domain-containing protein [Bacteroidia bacterium]|nr:glucosaminidase domain-containing protein [Bacteroidia bacterium]